MLNLYMPDQTVLQTDDQEILNTLLDTTALALEGERLRTRELITLSQLRTAHQKTDLKTTLMALLPDLSEMLGAEYAILVLVADGHTDLEVDFSSSLVHGILSVGEMLQARPHLAKAFETGEIQVSNDPDMPALLSLPVLLSGKQRHGVLLFGDRNGIGFSQRQKVLAQMAADQIALILQTTGQMADIQYHAMMDERMRLAREIHDGVAQTLGFLKLQIAQIWGYQERGEVERLRQVIRQSYDALAEAYRDVREAIDMLRISPESEGGYSLSGWLNQIVSEFNDETTPSLKITVSEVVLRSKLVPELHAQLIRIVQEALSNVRKHAHAREVWISCREIESDVILEIRDDGIGFAAEQVPLLSQHGLRGMRERAELLGADFQVISRPGEGSTVRIRLPLEEHFRMEI